MKKFLITLGILLFAFLADAEASYYSDYENWDWSRPYYVEDILSEKEAADEEYSYNDAERDYNVKILKSCRGFEKYKGTFPDDEKKIKLLEECLLFKTTANLKGQQISDLVKPAFNVYYVSYYIYPYYKLPGTKNISLPYQYEWYIRMYNMATKDNWPECPYETGEHIDSAVNEPCNEEGEILKTCREENTDIIICMQKKLLEKFVRYSWTKHHEKIYGKKSRVSYPPIVMWSMWGLLGRTYLSVRAVAVDSEEHEKQLVRMYNFYDLMMEQAHRRFEEYFKSNKAEK